MNREYTARPTFTTAGGALIELKYSVTVGEVLPKMVGNFTATITGRKIVGDTVFLRVQCVTRNGARSFEIPEQMLDNPSHLARAFLQGAGVGASIAVGRKAALARYVRDYLAHEFTGPTVTATR